MHIIGVNDKNDNWLGIIIQNKTLKQAILDSRN